MTSSPPPKPCKHVGPCICDLEQQVSDEQKRAVSAARATAAEGAKATATADRVLGSSREISRKFKLPRKAGK